jgi:hypothetical protein
LNSLNLKILLMELLPLGGTEAKSIDLFSIKSINDNIYNGIGISYDRSRFSPRYFAPIPDFGAENEISKECLLFSTMLETIPKTLLVRYLNLNP